MKQADKIIRKLKLIPHPEGGYFRETYRSSGKIEQDDMGVEFSGRRSFSTCIYFLLTGDTFSAFHRIRQDEIWHFYDGSPIRLHIISKKGVYSNVIIGRDLDEGQIPQFVVDAGTWFAATIVDKNDYSLLGCTVSPGFDFRDFELAKRDNLIKEFPQHEKIIKELTTG
jgi:predicted cupin superfamily sugar epimerase